MSKDESMGSIRKGAGAAGGWWIVCIGFLCAGRDRAVVSRLAVAEPVAVVRLAFSESGSARLWPSAQSMAEPICATGRLLRSKMPKLDRTRALPQRPNRARHLLKEQQKQIYRGPEPVLNGPRGLVLEGEKCQLDTAKKGNARHFGLSENNWEVNLPTLSQEMRSVSCLVSLL